MSLVRTGLSFFALCMLLSATSSCNGTGKKEVAYKPVIDGEWHNITAKPDLGELGTEKTTPVDFAVWKAKDGTWQLWSCVRGTRIGGRNRLFYRWEGQSLEDTAWKPMGIAMQADTTLGELKGGLQAPFVFQENGVYYMFYGDWNNICLARSDDGKTFTRVLNENNSAALFSGPLYHARDAMVLKVKDTYYCYYSANNETDNKTGEPQGAIFCRTSKDMKLWSDAVVVSRGGTPQQQTHLYYSDIECPFVVHYKDKFILFRNHRYQKYEDQFFNTQYCSTDPLDFGDGHDGYMVGQLHVVAPEIIKEGDQYYVVSLKPGLDGMKIAKIKFVEHEAD